MNLGSILYKISRLEEKIASIEHLTNIRVDSSLRIDEVKGEAGGLSISVQDPITEEVEFWARIDDYDSGTGFYGWVEAIPVGYATFEDNEYGLTGTVTQSPLYQANGKLLADNGYVRIKRAFYHEDLEWVYVTDSLTSTGGGGSGITHVNGETGPEVRIGLGRSGTGPNLGSTAAAWSSSVAYQVGDVVSLSGDNYYCILANTNHTPPNATYWTLTTEDLIVANLPDASDTSRGQVNLLPAQQFGGSSSEIKYTPGTFGAGQFRICQGNPVGAGGTFVSVDSWNWTGISPTSTVNPGFQITYTSAPNHVSYNTNGIGTYNQNHTYEFGECVAFEGYIYSALTSVPMGSYPSPSISYPTPSGFWERVYDTANIYDPLLALSTYGYMYPTHGYMATPDDPTFAIGGVPANTQPIRGFYGSIFGMNFGGGILLRGGGPISVSGSYITPSTLPTTVLAPSFYLPAANAGTVLEAENKSGSTISPGMVVTTHSSGTGFVLADATGIGTSVTGIARESIANTVSGEIQSEGLITLADWTAATGSSTLAAKANYFSDPANPGKLTTTPPTTVGYVVQLVGVAVSSDTMDLILSSPILL